LYQHSWFENRSVLCSEAAYTEEFFHLQGIVAEINQAIGAKGVVSNQCKMVVQQYGDQIVEMLLAQVIRDNTRRHMLFLYFSGKMFSCDLMVLVKGGKGTELMFLCCR
jgi:hypothetical protein